jgi:hypothetical protein
MKVSRRDDYLREGVAVALHREEGQDVHLLLEVREIDGVAGGAHAAALVEEAAEGLARGKARFAGELEGEEVQGVREVIFYRN